MSNRRTQILDTALALAFDGGPNAVTTVAIAQCLGLTQPAIYRHFRSKADLWRAITDRLGGEIAANIDAATTLEAPAIDRLRALVLGHLALVSRTPALPEIMVARDSDDEKAAMRAAMREHILAFQAALVQLCAEAQSEDALRGNISPNDLATLLMGVLQSLVLRLLLNRDPTKLLDEGERLLSLQISAFARESEA
ncbi:TetR/AcrR family transcriptional regulator [Sinisalibacter lacisalsi]|uniref:Nucleoid occlusion factor SlmA n=1 Tax=Sinisalibacter lacisalsi TaxID=1526570 RepID=A0ABQ1QKB2_9RHOB|nr:TetR/AcrR family transcriptional regulator [Sinisalibacter lacisalsi]GGD28975.1 nucleoid occlusion factor SlmA [Sinisalibacter lacisalsi]